MKKSHIIGIIIIAVAIGAIMLNVMNTSTYANFKEAFENTGKKYTVTGKLNKDKMISYNPSENPNIFEFFMIDHDGNEKRVVVNKSKPQDFERSESVVVKGKAKEDAFYATDILMKCPSKYNEQQEFKVAE